MISRRYRRPTKPSEQLRHMSITGVKGVDTTKANVDLNTMLEIKNMEPDIDGALKLRKPLIYKETIPEVLDADGVVVPTTVILAKYIYDNSTKLIIRKGSTGIQYFGLFKENEDINERKLRLVWRSWIDYSEYTEQLTYNTYIQLPYIDFGTVCATNTSTTTILTGTTVDLANVRFRRVGGTYAAAEDTDLFNHALYDETTICFKPRTIIISDSEDITDKRFFDFTIVTPDVVEINSADILKIDPNLDLDNPYSLRDRYNSAAPIPKAILPYVSSIKVGDTVQYKEEDINRSPIETVNVLQSNTEYCPYEVDIQKISNNSTSTIYYPSYEDQHISDTYMHTTFAQHNVQEPEVPIVDGIIPTKRVSNVSVEPIGTFCIEYQPYDYDGGMFWAIFTLDTGMGGEISRESKTTIADATHPATPILVSVDSSIHTAMTHCSEATSIEYSTLANLSTEGLLACYQALVNNPTVSNVVINDILNLESIDVNVAYIRNSCPESIFNVPNLSTKVNTKVSLLYTTSSYIDITKSFTIPSGVVNMV